MPFREQLVTNFACALGWDPPRRYQHRVEFASDQRRDIVWYESGVTKIPRLACFLQINVLGNELSLILCSAAVYAPRFQICTGWHPFKLALNARREDEKLSPEIEANRLRDWLQRELMASAASRQLFRRHHPETVGYSWHALREYGPPYQVRMHFRAGRPTLMQLKSTSCRKVLANLRK
jgi:hypothetical protein